MQTVLSPNQVLKNVFGYDSFRPMQAEIVQTLLNGQDAVVIMPTGGGKSICFQVPALLSEGLTIVVSPLISLMKDQVDSLQQNGVEAAFLNSSQTQSAAREVEEKAKNGTLKLLYMAPETLITGGYINMVAGLNPALFAIDEAHCISSWGHDFRPEYQKLKILKEKFPNIPVVALTATADRATREDIAKGLELQKPEVFIASFDRPNLSLKVAPGQKKFDQIEAFLRLRPNQSGIIYCLSRKNTEDLAAKLNGKGYNVGCYHAGMSAEARANVQSDFISDKIPIICATVAFGMGIDKSNVRWVIHHNLPKNIEGFYQEIGRAGRDGLPSDTLLFYSYADVAMLMNFIDDIPNPKFKAVQEAKLNRMKEYAEASVCRRKILLSYFGEAPAGDCGNCDVCKNPPKFFDGTKIAQIALSAVARMKETAAMGVTIDVLRGSQNQTVLSRGFQQIKTFGAGKTYSYFDWQIYMTQLVQQGFLEIAYHENTSLKLTALSQKVLFEGEQVKLVDLAARKESAAPSYKKVRKVSESQKMDDSLFEKLRTLRTQLAKKQNVAAYLIFSDAALKEMSAQKPVDPSSFLEISGVGQHKLEQFGDAYMDAIAQFLAGKAAEGKRVKGGTTMLTFKLFQDGQSIKDIAAARELSPTTILSHLATFVAQGKLKVTEDLVPAEKVKRVEAAYKELGKQEALKPYFEFLNGEVGYGEIRLVLAALEAAG